MTWSVYAVGVLVRWFHLTKWHDPRQFLLSDVPGYLALAKRVAQPDYVLGVKDTLYAPGNAWLLTFFLKRDPSLQQMVHFNFVICALVPLAIGALGWVTFGRRTAQAAIVFASGYFAIIDIGGYFLPDVHLAFLATLTVVTYLQAMKLVAEEASTKRGVGFIGLAALSGLLFALAMAMSSIAAPAVVAFCATHFLFTRGPRPRRKALVLAIFLLASAPLTAMVAKRCTTANQGHFCSSSTGRSADFLLGHYDRILSLEWTDPAAPTESTTRLNSEAQQHGSGDKRVVPFLITNQDKNSEYAWKWIRRNPAQAVVLSLEHISDCFGGTYAWPALTTEVWRHSYAAHFLFLLLVLLPSTIVLVDLLRRRGLVGVFRSTEFLLISPLFGVSAAAFATIGEARFRIPWDGFFIVVAIQFYRRYATDGVDTSPPVPANDADASETRAVERRIRAGALALLAAVILTTVVCVVWAWPDGRRFQASSSGWAGFPVSGRVGDRRDSGLFFHTAEENNPWVEVDLGELREVSRVTIENRVDGYGDRAVPLIVELGDSERHFHEVAQRDEVFDIWVVTFPKQKVRYVKLHVPRTTAFHLQNVEAN